MSESSSEIVSKTAEPQNDLSIVKGPITPDLTRTTIPQLLADAVSDYGARSAVVFREQNVRLSYAELGKEVANVAAGLVALGLEKGDRVGIWSPNRLEWILTQFATAQAGLILVNINPAYRLSELEYALNKVDCKALVLARSFKSSDYAEMIRNLAPELDTCAPGKLDSEKLPSLKSVIVMGDAPITGMLLFDDLANLGGKAEHQKLDTMQDQLDPDDAINIQFTSGTTGLPKGATLTHYNIVNNARFVTDRINLTFADRLAIPVPLYHCFGMVMGVLGAVSKGASMVFPGEAFDPVQTLEVLAAEKCTACYGVPTMFVAMLEDLENTPRDMSNLRTGIMAGATCPVEVMRRVNSEMNMGEVTICYGMTETSPVSFQSFVDDPTKKRCETVGRVHPHLEVKIVDEDGNTVPTGVQGELCTKGYSVMKGYWDEDEKTAGSIRDGWMLTGDLAVFDDEGFCTIVGRVKDMIIRGGENVYPREVEEYLMRHPKVSDAQVFGIPDDKFGEIVCAWAIPRPDEDLTADDIRDFCKGQIAHFKIPKHVRIVDELPMTITGKPQKFIMRDKMVEILASE